MQRANARGRTLSLFAEDEAIGQRRYSALVTDLNLPTLQVWRLYRGRADCENRIKELKYDFAADSLSLRDFWATEAALHTVMMAFILMSLFKQVLLEQTIRKSAVDQPIQHTHSPRCATNSSPSPHSSPTKADAHCSNSSQRCRSASGSQASGINPNGSIYPCRSPHNLRLAILPN